MAGAMAGSAILAAQSRRDTLGTVTLTINNVCNLSCPHCYLQYHGPKGTVETNVVDHILDSNCETVCIVGKEPLADAGSVEVVSRIVKLARRSGKSVGLITNGLNGCLLPDFVLEYLSWIDVSLDGGPATYRTYRRGSWEKLCASVSSMRSRGLRDLRLLQTLSSATLASISDMMEAARILGASVTMFSPYQPTRMQGSQFVNPVSPAEIVQALVPFVGNESIHLSFAAGYVARFGDAAEAIRLAKELFGDRFTYVDTDPIDRGLIRVTYDGLILTPFEAVDTTDYVSIGRRVLAQPIDSWFAAMLDSSRRAHRN